MALNKALDSIMVTTVSGKQISMFMRYFSQYIRPIPDFLGSIYAYYTEEELNALPKPDFKRLEEESERALEILDNELRELGKLIGKRGILYTTGYSHLDLAWLWSVDVTRQKIRRTVGDGTELEFVIMVIAVSCVKLLSAHNSTQHTSRKHKV
jgi:Glycosyl hydrolases family 38 N-terminal domain.